MTDQPLETGDNAGSNFSNNSGDPRSSSDHPRGRQRKPLPTVEEILQQLLQLNSAVAIGAMSTKEAGLIHKNLRIVLQTQMKRASREDTGPSQEALVDLCRKDPQALNLIEPFLTDEHVKWVMNELSENTDGPI